MILSNEEVKKVIKKNKLKFREFYINKEVFGVKKDSEVVAMCAVSSNKQLRGAKKLYSPFFTDEDSLKTLIKEIVNSCNKKTVIYTDCLEEAVPIFKKLGFDFIKQTKSKRYESLWRGILNARKKL